MKLTQKNLLDLHIKSRQLHEDALAAYTVFNLNSAAASVYMNSVEESSRDLRRILDAIENQE